MRIREYKSDFIQTLTPIYGADESESFFYMILEERHLMRRIDLALQPEKELTQSDAEFWNTLVNGLLKQTPIQYLLGTAHFCGLQFKVSPSVLIPRPETEELVEWIADKIDDNHKSILDIGTGSGCIAISLAHKFPEVEVHAIDISDDALKMATENAKLNQVSVQFHETDILSTEILPQKFDIIVSNPPYVRELEKVEIKDNVLENEPHLALFVADDDALLFYRKITLLAQDFLSEEGLLFFEINQYLANETIAMLSQNGFTTELRKDIYGNNRMICAQKIIRTAALQ